MTANASEFHDFNDRAIQAVTKAVEKLDFGPAADLRPQVLQSSNNVVVYLAPLPLVVPKVHEFDGWSMTFWEYVDTTSQGSRVPEASIGAALADAHQALRSYTGRLPRWQNVF